MSTSAGRVVLTFDVDDKGVVQGLGRVKGEVDKSASSISTKAIAMGTAIGTAAGKLAVDALKHLGREFVEIASRGIELAPVVTSFQSLTSSIGQSGDAMLSVTRDASKGLITDLDLMQAANKAILLGLPVTAESMGTMAQAAVALGKAMNQGATKSFDDLITALGRSSPMILDNLGLSVKVGEANDVYARSVGKTAEQLTDAEKKLAFYNAAMDAARAKVADVGGIQLTLADRIQIAKNAMANFTDALGVAVATSPVINAAFAAAGEALQGAFGTNSTQTVQTLIKWVNEIAIKVVTFGQAGIFVAKGLAAGFAALKTVFLAISTVVGGVISGLAEGAAQALSFATKIPGIGDSFEGAAAAARRFADTNHASVGEMAAMTAEAAKGVVGNDALGQTLDRVGDTLTTMKTRMEEARNTQADTAEIARQLTTATTDQAAAQETAKKAAEATTKAIDAQRDAFRSLGLVTKQDVTDEIQRLQGALSAAAREGAGPTKRAVEVVITKLGELREKALAAGQSVDVIDAHLAALRDTIRDMNGPIPTLTTQITTALPTMAAAAGSVRVITSEMLKQRTESHLLASAYETLGVRTQASLTAQVTAARIAYADILASGQATARELQAARAAVEQAEIDAGLRTVSLWQTQIEPAIKQAGQNILGSLSTNFTDMLTGAVGFKDGFVNIWEDLKSAVGNVLNTLLQTFLNEFLGGMLQGLSGWAAQAGRIFGSVFSMGNAGMSGMLSPSVLTAPGMGAGAGGGVGAGAALGMAGLGVAAAGAGYTLGKMGFEWATAAFGDHYISPEAQAEADRLSAIQAAEYTGAAARAGMTPEEFIDSGGTPGFAAGGEVFAGAGMDARLHGHEAVFPLPDGFDLAASLQALEQMYAADQPADASAAVPMAVPTPEVHVYLGNHEFRDYVVETNLRAYEENRGGGAPVGPTTRARLALGVA
jgi:hypothetical protein